MRKNTIIIIIIVMGIACTSPFIISEQKDINYWQQFKNYVHQSRLGEWFKKETILKRRNKNIIYLHEQIQKKTTRDWAPFFEAVIGAEDVVLMFFAYYCRPCHAMMPAIDSVAAQMPQLKFIKIEYELFSLFSDYFKIQSIPTLIFLRNRSEIGRYEEGPLSEQELANIVIQTYSK